METGSPGKRPVLPKRARLLVTAGMGMLALLLFGPRLVDIYVDWLWFGEVGFRSVWITVLLTRLAIVAAVALVVAGIVLAALLLAYRSRPFFVPDEPQRDPVAPLRSAVMRRPRLFGWGIAVTLGVVCGLIASFDWVKVQLFVHGGTFGIVDPEFGYDIGFFVFDLPFYRSVLNWLFVAVVLAFLASLLTHYLFGGLRLTTGRGMLTQAARVQLAVFAGAVVLLKAVAYWLDRYELLSSGRKEPTFTGAGYTDIHAELPAKLVLVAIAVLCAVSFFTAIFLRDLRIPAMAAALLVLSAILVGGLWPLLMEQFSVRPNAADVERPYIQRNIEATREAYRIGGDWVQYRSYPGIGTKQPRDVPVDVTTIAKVRLLDPHILSRTFTQQQQLKNFFSFAEILDIDRYRIDGELQDYIVGVVRQGKQVSYVRNSVKATVDAYDGTVTLFQFDRDDPVLRTWMRAFPGTVKSEDQIPDELRAHFRYPEDLFEVQRSLLAKYHVDEPREFFTTNAFWSVPSDPTNDANATQPPFYVLVGDQQSAQPSFRLASAMVGYNREFLSAYISAHSDPANYGKLTVLELPTDTLTQGPQQIQNSMISDTRVASERTLLERSNRIHYGNLLSLPIADGGVLYVEPLYTERISTSPSSSTFPQLSRVLVSVREPRTEGGVRVGYAPTLAESLDQVFGPGTGRVATAPGGDAASAPPPGAGGPAPPQAVPPPRTTQPPAAPPRGPDVPPATVAELRETLADLRAVLDRLEKAIDAAETPGG